MIDVLILTDATTSAPCLETGIFASFNTVEMPIQAVDADTIRSVRCIVVLADLRDVKTVQRIAELCSEHRRCQDTLYIASDRDRTGLVQAEALRIGRVFAPHDKPEAICQTILDILNRELDAKLETQSAVVAAAVKATDALYREVSAAMRAKQPPSLESLGVSVAAIDAAIRTDGLSNWLEAVELHHSQTCRHTMSVAGHANAFARHLGVDDEDTRLLVTASLLHDVGKLFIPISILEKAGPLSAEERKAVMTHPARGEDALRQSGQHVDPIVLSGVRSHHEVLDGSGYPEGLRGDQIPPLVRMLTIVDIYSAIVEKRSYKPAMPPRQAITEMIDMRAKLDQSLFKAFRTMVLKPAFGTHRTPRARTCEPRGCIRFGIHPLGHADLSRGVA